MADKGLFSDMGHKAKKNLEIAVAIGVIALALLLLLPGLNFLSGDENEQQTSSAIFNADAEHNALEQTLSAIKGAGKVEVMITYRVPDKSPEPVATLSQSTGGFGGSYYSNSSAGAESKTYEQRPEVLGVVVVAEGADDISVRIALAGAVQTALGITADRVDVYEMSK